MIIMDVGNTDRDTLYQIINDIDMLRDDPDFDLTLFPICDDWWVENVTGGARLLLAGHDAGCGHKTLQDYAGLISERLGADVRIVMTTMPSNVFADGSEFSYVGDSDRCETWADTHQVVQAIALLKERFSAVEIAALPDEHSAMRQKWAQGMLWLGVEQRDTAMILAAAACGADSSAPDFMGSAPLARLADTVGAPDKVRELARDLLPPRACVRPG